MFYVVARARAAERARRVMNDLVIVPSIATVGDPVLRRALALGWPDFEDAVCAAAAEAASCDLLVTRNLVGFKDSPVPVVDPVTAFSLVRGGKGPSRTGERPGRGYRSRPTKRGDRPRKRLRLGLRGRLSLVEREGHVHRDPLRLVGSRKVREAGRA